MRLKALFLLATLFLLTALPALAQQESASCDSSPDPGAAWLSSIGIKNGHFIPRECSDSCINTKCDLNSAFQLIINFTQVLLALTGSVAILMFIFGGTMMIIGGAAGDQAKNITRGKDAIKAAVIGLVVILGAWLVVNFTILALTGGQIGTTATIFNQNFNEAPAGGDPSSFERGNTSGGATQGGVGVCDEFTVDQFSCTQFCGGSGVQSMNVTNTNLICCVCAN